MIAEPGGSDFKPSLFHFQSYHLPPYGFDSAVDFVDQLDLDGDGVGEVGVCRVEEIDVFFGHGRQIITNSAGRPRGHHQKKAQPKLRLFSLSPVTVEHHFWRV